MNARLIHVKTVEHALMESIHTLVLAFPGIQETTVKLILTNARLIHVKTVEHALMESIHILVLALSGIQETTVKQVT